MGDPFFCSKLSSSVSFMREGRHPSRPLDCPIGEFFFFSGDGSAAVCLFHHLAEVRVIALLFVPRGSGNCDRGLKL